ncbi:MAG: hypothetical protein ACK40V_02520, partial [Anaerolineales bacterium]
GICDFVVCKFNSPKLSWSKDKSVAVSIAVFIGGWVMSAIIIFMYVNAGVFAGTISNYLLPITVVALIGMFVESLPYKDIDNITMTAASVLVGHLFF